MRPTGLPGVPHETPVVVVRNYSIEKPCSCLSCTRRQTAVGSFTAKRYTVPLLSGHDHRQPDVMPRHGRIRPCTSLRQALHTVSFPPSICSCESCSSTGSIRSASSMHFCIHPSAPSLCPQRQMYSRHSIISRTRHLLEDNS